MRVFEPLLVGALIALAVVLLTRETEEEREAAMKRDTSPPHVRALIDSLAEIKFNMTDEIVHSIPLTSEAQRMRCTNNEPGVYGRMYCVLGGPDPIIHYFHSMHINCKEGGVDEAGEPWLRDCDGVGYNHRTLLAMGTSNAISF